MSLAFAPSREGAGLGAGIGLLLGLVLFGNDPGWKGLSFVLACLGTIVGAVAGAAGEIVTAQRRVAEPMSKRCETWE